MEIVGRVLLVLHLVGWAIVLGGALVSLRPPRIPTGMLHGALTALVTGLTLGVLVSTGALDWDVAPPWLAVKFVVALAVTGLVVWGGRRMQVSRGLVCAIAGLTLTNVAIAVLWQ